MDYTLMMRSTDKSVGDDYAYTVLNPNWQIPDGDYMVAILFSMTTSGSVVQVQIRSDALVRCLTTNNDGWFTFNQCRINSVDTSDKIYETNRGVVYMNKSPQYIQIRFINVATNAPMNVTVGMDFVFNFKNMKSGEMFQHKYKS